MPAFALVCGLGNPGPEYEQTRHNCGFLTVDALGEELGASYWKLQDGCLVSEVKVDGEPMLLAKPQAFMNKSGGPLSHLMSRHGIEPEEILVIHDDLDLPEGTLRFKRGGGHGGHNGLRSINQAIGQEYARLKVGIGRPPGRMDPADYVLARVAKAQIEDFEASIASAQQAALCAIRKGLDAAMLEFN